MQEETIVALATPPGEGAVGMIRLSGGQAVPIADRVFRSLHGKGKLEKAPSHRLLHGVAVDPLTGRVLDEVLVAVARGPRSYTGEDVVEFFCHGGLVVLGEVLAALREAGARPAGPGEFTLRAFLNGRMDLSQAEAVVDVVRARSAEALQCAVGGLLGALGGRVRELAERLVGTLAHLEASLDFPDEEVPPVTGADVAEELRTVQAGVRALLAGAGRGRLYREGLRAVLVGRPNVGKSSLLNALVGRERAIVTGVPGTTRDVIEESVVLQGVPVCLVDTAGLRVARDLVEEEGIRRAREAARGASVAVLVVDGSEPLQEEDRVAAECVRGQAAVVAVNKADRRPAVTDGEARELLPGRAVVRLSAKTGEGLPALEEAILAAGRTAVAGEGGGTAGWEGRQDALVTRARHEEALRRAEREIGAALSEVRREAGEELVAARVRRALHALGEITGESVDDDVLRAVFATFCIGK
ncbi:MAG: tRNA uridine-5-carboxymethylaminomethyl(34) synthesis GTPase MnmE [Bacillota bacterium]|nr:tRNA uridine-5-carboxymethylaminomethyl(34) synthesis GTPase MnmE [Bacillota bacterium]